MFLPLVLLACIFTCYLPGGEAVCRDLNQYCKSWARQGECTKNPGYMKVNCKKSCGLCGGGGGSGCDNCRDKRTECNYWARTGQCRINPGYMRVNCPFSCKICTCTPKPRTQPPRTQPPRTQRPKRTTDFPSPPVPVTGDFTAPPIPTEILPSPPLPSKPPTPPVPTTAVPPPVPGNTTTPMPPIPENTTRPMPPIPENTTTPMPPIPDTTTAKPPPLPPASVCNQSVPVGIAVGSFPNEAFKASTSESRWHQPDQARLNLQPSDESVGAWCAGLQDKNQSIKVDLGEVKNITAILTQGRESEIPKYVTSYYVDYSKDGTNWSFIPEERNPNNAKEFTGNTDTSDIKKNKLRVFVLARHLRIRPKEWKNMICMRLEFEYCVTI